MVLSLIMTTEDNFKKEKNVKSAFSKIETQAFEAGDFLNIFGNFETYFLLNIFLIKNPCNSREYKKRNFLHHASMTYQYRFA